MSAEPQLDLRAETPGGALHLTLDLRSSGPDEWFIMCLQASPLATDPSWSAAPWVARDRSDASTVIVAWTVSPPLGLVSSSPVGFGRRLVGGQALQLELTGASPLATRMPTAAPGGKRVEINRVRVVVELRKRRVNWWSRWTRPVPEVAPGVFRPEQLPVELRVVEQSLARPIELALGEPAWTLDLDSDRLRGEPLPGHGQAGSIPRN